MKKLVFLLLISAVFLAACSTAIQPTQPTETPNVQIANPWKSYGSLEEAETACSLAFPVPERVADLYTAESFRVMNGQLLEVTYRAGEDKIVIRMQIGEGQDLSGVYADADSTEEIQVNGAAVTVKKMGSEFLHLISANGCSYSLYAPAGYRADSAQAFLSCICGA